MPDFPHHPALGMHMDRDVKEEHRSERSERLERSERSASSHSEYSSSGENDNDSSRSPNTFLRPPSSHQTPSPFSEPELLTAGRGKLATESLRSPTSPHGHSAFTTPPPLPGQVASPRVLFPPLSLPALPAVPGVARPGLAPTLMFLDPSVPPRAGGDLALASPALGGVAEDQDQPMDLSIKSSALSARTPPSPRAPPSPVTVTKLSDGQSEEDTKEPRECVLDLTSKRGSEVPQSG